MWERGPVASSQYPLLTDDQVLSLLCEGSPDLLPSAEVSRDILSGLDLDLHLPDARARAIHCSAIFAEWWDGTYEWQNHNGVPLGDSRAGVWCSLAHTRASMGRLIAGLDGSKLQAGSATEAVVYTTEAIPVGGFFCLDFSASTQEGRRGIRLCYEGWLASRAGRIPRSAAPPRLPPTTRTCSTVCSSAPVGCASFPLDPQGNRFFTLSLWSSARAYASRCSLPFRLARTRHGSG